MNKKLLLISLLTSTILFSCQKKEEDEDVDDNNSNVVQTAESIAGAAAGASENGLIGLSTEALQPFSTSCAYSSYSCIGSAKNLDWNNCTIATVTMTGGWTEAYNTGGCCSSFGNGCSNTRTTYSGGSIATRASGATLTTTSENHTAYDSTSIPGASGITTVNSSGTRTVTINGLHRVLRGPGGSRFFDHSILTVTPITITGARLTSNRVITGGVLDIYHNLASYKARHTFSSSSQVTWGLAGCCHPTSGVITSVFSGSITGTTTLTFTSTCGNATFVDTDSSSRTITLNQCE